MKRRLPQISLPLLARDLSDQAQRARHYFLRALFAAVVSLFGFIYLRELELHDETAPGAVGLMSLGHGEALFDQVCRIELFGILLLLPAMTCGAIASEKERNTLSVLLTTRLGPLTIVLEKLLSRLILFFMLMLLSVPLLTFAYSMGGIALNSMMIQVVRLGSLSVLVATLSLLCSAWCGSTVSAFFMTYAVGIALSIGFSCLAAPVVFGIAARNGNSEEIAALLMVALTFVAAPLFFFLSVACLVQRAFVTPRNFMLSFFGALDRFYNRINVLAGNVVIARDRSLLPDEQPIAWRETSKKSLGTLRYLVRVLVAIELPTIFVLHLESTDPGSLGSDLGVASWIWIIVWCIAASLIAVMCGSLISGEQTRQTLPVLLTTPIPGNQIIDQLFAGVRRLICVLCIPFATIAGYEYWFHLGMQSANQSTLFERFLGEVLQLAIFPLLIAWGTFYLGAKIRSPMRAVVTSLLAVTAVVGGPYLLEWLVHWMNPHTPGAEYLAWLSPATIVILNEERHATYWMTAIYFLVFGGILFGLRWHCRQQADRLLGRMEAARPERVTQTPSAVHEEMAPA